MPPWPRDRPKRSPCAEAWRIGGITFFLYVVLTLTGIYLMFYFHPSKVQAFRDILYLRHDVPFGSLLRNMHRWAAHAMVVAPTNNS